jgi:hypothetical protein
VSQTAFQAHPGQGETPRIGPATSRGGREGKEGGDSNSRHIEGASAVLALCLSLSFS